MNPLQQGSTGADVAKLQTSLKAAGFDPGNIDSQFGPKTATALSAYQTSKGLKADSIFGPITSGSLYGTQGTPGGTAPIGSSNGMSPIDLSTKMDQTKPPTIPDGWDSQTYYNFKKANPTLEPTAEDTARMNGTYSNTSGVGTSTVARAAALQKIKDDMNSGLTTPTPYKSLDEFNKLRTDQGVVQDENELASIKNDQNQIQQTLREFSSTAGEGTSEAGRIGAVSEAERNAQFRLDSLNLRETAVTNRLNTKNSYINTVLQLGKDDYQTAYTNYTNEYNKNIKAIDLYNSNLDDQKKDALTGFTTITNLLKDANVTKLDPAVSQQLDTLALQAGLPKGLFQSVISSTGTDKILSPVMVDTASGKDIYFYTQDKNGVPSLKTVQHLAGKGTGDGSVDLSTDKKSVLLGANFTAADIANIQSDINAHGIDAVLAGVKDDKQKQAIQEVYGSGKGQTKLTRESVSSLYSIPDDSEKTGFLGFGKTNAEKLNDIMSSIKKYQDVGYSDDDILKLIQKQ